MQIENFTALVKAPSVCGRVVAHNRDIYGVDVDGQTMSAQLLGALRHDIFDQIDLPAVGDYVSLKVDGGVALIEKILPRSNTFARRAIYGSHELQVIATNLDTLFITIAVNRDFNPRRLERYAVAATAYGVPFAIALTKIDLVEDPILFIEEAQAAVPGTPVIAISALSKTGLESLEPFRGPARTIAFVGSSGVGKSTLINALLGEDLLAVNVVRGRDDRGRHTTTNRLLLYLNDGTAIIDTPGMREFALADAEAGLDATFTDVAMLAEECRFRDCRHITEPGCAVRESVDDSRLASWHKLGREAAFEARKTDRALAEKERDRWKAIAKAHRKKERY